jgi:hypothetical protein
MSFDTCPPWRDDAAAKPAKDRKSYTTRWDTIALDVHLDDHGVVHEAIDGSDGHGRIGEHGVPLREWLVRGDQHAATLVPAADEFEQDRGFGLILPDIGQVVEHQQVVAVEPGDGGFEGQCLARGLQALHQVGGPGEQHAVAILDQGTADGGGDVGLAGARRAEQQQVGTLVEPGIAGGEVRIPTKPATDSD